jgi:hypothetical protein
MPTNLYTQNSVAAFSASGNTIEKKKTNVDYVNGNAKVLN